MNLPIYLDWDGVVVDSLELYLDFFRKLCREHDKTLPVADAKDFREWYQPNWEINFTELGFSRSEYLEICEHYPKELDYNQADVFPGISELVTTLAEKHKMVVVSTAPTENIKSRLKSLNLSQYFSFVTGSDDGSTDKSERLASLGIQLGTKKGIMVGDTDLDIKAGHDNDLITVGVTYGWISPARVSKAKPHYLVDKPADLLSTLRQAVTVEKQTLLMGT